MKNRAKHMKTEQDQNNNNLSSDFNYISCKKHPKNQSLVGICAYCLNEKLINLICSDCGEQRISTCSCSEFPSSYRNSSYNFDLGNMGRISFFIEKEKISNYEEQKSKQIELEESEKTGESGVLLKRSNSCVLEVKKSNGFWKIGKIFKKKIEKNGLIEKNKDQIDQNSDISSAKISDFHEFESRKSGFKGQSVDFDNRFCKMDDFNDDYDDEDDEFIELKIDLIENSKTEDSVFKEYEAVDIVGDDVMGSSSCRITVNERGFKKVKNSHGKGWKWMFKHRSVKKILIAS